MSGSAEIWILVDNVASQRGWLAEHGLSLLVVAPGGRRILFDSGQGMVLNRNAGIVGIRPADIDLAVLSHGHYDHGGGLSWFFGREHRPTLYAHPQVFTHRWIHREQGERQAVGIPWTRKQIESHIDLVLTRETTELGGGVFFSGEIEDRHPEEEIEKGFVVSRDGSFVRDALPDDACLWLEIGEKRIVVLGCAHAGVISTLDHITAAAGPRPIELLIGGMHLIHADEERLEWTAEHLRRHQVRHVVPLHCTGQHAAAYLAHRLGGRITFAGTGESFEVPA